MDAIPHSVINLDDGNDSSLESKDMKQQFDSRMFYKQSSMENPLLTNRSHEPRDKHAHNDDKISESKDSVQTITILHGDSELVQPLQDVSNVMNNLD